ncbi:MAG: bifunctional UDP-4-keto-pentose/UDP-xylose synthase [Albidovulum sp.]
MGGVRHGHEHRPRRRPRSTTRASTSSRATSPSTRSGSSTTCGSATWCCRWWRSRRPSTYVSDPLRVFELDFEANLPIVRQCVKYGKRLVFPSTSEVYGMCRDEEFDPDDLRAGLRPDRQAALDLLVRQAADGPRDLGLRLDEGLDFTLFRPFNWIGAGLDSIHTPKEGSSRVITQFFGHIVRGEPIKLVDGGAQKRAFTYIDDGIAALMRIIENEDGMASGKIYNIGNPANNYSVRELATMMLELAAAYPEYREQRRPREGRRDHVRRLLRQGLPGRAEPRAEDRQHDGRPRLGAEGRDARRAAAHLRSLPHPDRRGSRPRRLIAACRSSP